MRSVLLIWLCLGSVSLAQQIVVVHGGKAYLVTLFPLMEIPLATTGGTPNPKPPKPPATTVAKQVAAWTKAISPAPAPETVKALVLTTQAIRKQVESGKTKWSDVWGGKKLFSTAYDVVIGAQDETARWKPWRKNHENEVIRQIQDKANGLNSDAEVIQLLTDTEAGLQGYLDGSGLLGNLDLKKIIRIVSLLISMDGFDISTIMEILRILIGEARLR